MVDAAWEARPSLFEVTLLATSLPTLAVGSRRLQDIDFPGYLELTPLLALPIYWLASATDQTLLLYLAQAAGGACGVVLLILAVFPSQPEANAYGPNPLETVEV